MSNIYMNAVGTNISETIPKLLDKPGNNTICVDGSVYRYGDVFASLHPSQLRAEVRLLK